MSDHLDLADEIALALATVLDRPGEMDAFLSGRRVFMVRREGIAIFEEAPAGSWIVPGSGAN